MFVPGSFPYEAISQKSAYIFFNCPVLVLGLGKKTCFDMPVIKGDDDIPRVPNYIDNLAILLRPALVALEHYWR